MKKKNSTRPAWVPVVKFITVLVTLALIFLAVKAVGGNYVSMVEGRPVLLTADRLDLRDIPLTVEEYEDLKQENPDKEILWCVPLGGAYHESDSAYIILENLSRDEISNIDYLKNLKTIDAGKCRDHEALAALEAAYPNLEINWNIHLGGRIWSREETDIDLRGLGIGYGELVQTVGYFPAGTKIQIDETLTDEERQELVAAFPEHRFSWGVELMGKIYSSGTEKLDFAGKSVDLAALLEAAGQFSGVKEVDLRRCGLTVSELAAVQDAYPGALIRGEISLFGMDLTTDMEEIDFSGIKMKSTEEIEAAVKLMPNLKKVIMSDCGFSNEEMDALNKRHENVLFVWTVHFSVYSLRTDTLGFCASDVPELGYIAPKLTNKDLEPLKYCTELIALDLGHMRYTDLSFLENMHKLEYLILVDAMYSDISILSQMKNLKYLEIFKNTLDDLSPLLECKNLKHLNIGYTRGFDPEVLKQMTWLERLWFPGHRLDETQKQAIIDALPGVQVYMKDWDTDGSTGGGWREADVYFEMRNLFGMFYQPGGTGMNN